MKVKQIIIVKTITSMCFILIALTAYFLNQDSINYFKIIIIGLSLGFFGDVSLAFKDLNPHYKSFFFLIGLILFFFGHLFYIWALSRWLSDQLWLYVIIMITVIFIFIMTIIKAKIIFSKLKLPCYLYLLASSIILTIALVNAIYNPSLFNLTLTSGATFFVASDYILSFLYFKKVAQKQKLYLKRLNLSLYYSGQFLIALSIFLI